MKLSQPVDLGLPASFDIPPAMGYKHRETALP